MTDHQPDESAAVPPGTPSSPDPPARQPEGAGPAAPEPATVGPASAATDDDQPVAGRDTGAAGDTGVPDGGSRPAARPTTRRRLTGAGAMIGILLGLVGFALVVQVRSNTSDSGLTTARPDDLVRILSDLDSRQTRLRQEISSLEETQRQLAAGNQGGEAALQQARRRADELGLLAGTLPATGTGLSIAFAPGREPIRASTILDSVEELRGAGAEVMQIGDGRNTVRIVASTYFADDGNDLVVDGTKLSGTYTLSVIGDPQTMRPALDIPGGVVDTVHQHGGNVIVREPGTVDVTTLHRVNPPRYAHPVP